MAMVVLLLASAAVARPQSVHTATRELANVFRQLQTYALGIQFRGSGGTVLMKASPTTTSYTVILPDSRGGVGYFICNGATPGQWSFCAPPANTFSPGGDLSGTSSAPVVSGLKNIPVVGLPANGQVYAFNVTGGQFSPITAGQHTVTVNWIASTTPNVRYNVYRGPSNGPYSLRNVAPISSTTYVDSGVVSGTQYCYVITAIDQTTGTESLNSTQSCGLIP